MEYKIAKKDAAERKRRGSREGKKVAQLIAQQPLGILRQS